MPHIPSRFTLVTSAIVVAFAMTSVAHAADDDRGTLRIAGMLVDGTTTVKGSADLFSGGYSYYDSRDFDLSSQVSPRIEGMFRFGDRNRLLFNYFGYDKEKSRQLGDDLTIGDVTFNADLRAKYKTQFDLASLSYEFAVIETEANTLGLQLGAHWARIKGTANATAEINGYQESFHVRESEDGYAPVVGVRWSSRTADGKWRLELQGQYLRTEWGDFGDYDGSLKRANILGEYRFTDNFGIHVGYDWFKLDVERDYYDDGNRYTPGLQQEFKGPFVGVTLAF